MNTTLRNLRKASVDVEVASPTPEKDVSPLSAEELAIGATLKGFPTSISEKVGNRLKAVGLAAETDEGWMRGYLWHNQYGN